MGNVQSSPLLSGSLSKPALLFETVVEKAPQERETTLCLSLLFSSLLASGLGEEEEARRTTFPDL